ncbi:MAG: A/G-specific adenine glycosylase [Deltaproteobacteria bacterium]|nr:A/G-specific adenine glycosylase [Deltaproteobacteria bacterium]
MKILRFQNSIVHWFETAARDLPWRKTSDPYKIWISEIMLQQTGVSTVIPYFERFMKRFPDVKSLARSTEDEVLHLWQGLGYYRRAKNLREGAKLIVEKFAGKFPDTKEDLLEVPGIGPYSAGAILSIAFRKQAPALDGNLIRVYSRFYGIQDFVNDTKTLKKLWAIATEHTPSASKISREFCEGMMELGATICTPKNPKCKICPVAWGCIARKDGNAETLPRKKMLRAREKYLEKVYLMEKAGKFGFLKKGGDPKFPDFLRLPYEALTTEPSPNVDQRLFKYSVTHRDFKVFVERKTFRSKAKLIWVSKSKLSKILLPAIDRKILNAYIG